MARVIFYEKPGCINNTRQKQLLRQSGHQVIAKNLLTENWAERPQLLQAFFTGKPVAEWFNPSAPAIRQGLVKPENVDAQQAIALMLAEPLLIRRPLMQVGEEKMSGFNEPFVDRWIGLKCTPDAGIQEACPRSP